MVRERPHAQRQGHTGEAGRRHGDCFKIHDHAGSVRARNGHKRLEDGSTIEEQIDHDVFGGRVHSQRGHNPSERAKIRRTQMLDIRSIAPDLATESRDQATKQRDCGPAVRCSVGAMRTNLATDKLMTGDRRPADRSRYHLGSDATEDEMKDVDDDKTRAMSSKLLVEKRLNEERFDQAYALHLSLTKKAADGSPSSLQDLIDRLPRDKEAKGAMFDAAYLNRVANLYKGATESDRRVLDLIMRSANPALNQDLYNELMSSHLGGGGMVGSSKSSEEAQAQEDLEELDQKISSTLVEGCFAKQRKRMTQKMIRIISLVSAMPCKTDEAHCQMWLTAVQAKPLLRVDPQTLKAETVTRRVKVHDPKTGALAEQDVPLLAWTPELEDTYRRDVLTRLMSLFYEEALSEALGMLSLDNSELPEPHAGFIIHLEKQKDKRFWNPKFTVDPTMSRWGNSIAIECMQLETIAGTHQSHTTMLDLLHSFRYGVLKQDVAMRMHMLVRGAPGTEKSETLKRLMAASISPTFMASDYQSKAAHMTNQAVDYVMQTHDEGPDWICGDVARMSRDQREYRDRMKKYMSSQEVAYQRSVENANRKGKGNREMENFRVSHIHSILAFTNEISPTNETSVLDRFRVLCMMPAKREDCTLGARVLFTKFNNLDQTYQDQWYAQKRNEHAIVGMMITAQNCRGLPDTNTSLFTVVMAAGTNEIQQWYPQINDRARAALRGEQNAENYTTSKVYDRVFCSEASPFIEWSADGSRIEQTSELRFEDLYRLTASMHFCEYDQALVAAAGFFQEHMPLPRFGLIFEAVSEICGFNRDFFLPSYAKYKIPLPDIYARALERGQVKEVSRGVKKVKVRMEGKVVTRMPDGTEIEQEDVEVEREADEWEKVGDPDQCSFIREFHEAELTLKARAAVRHPHRPSMEYGTGVDFESVQDKMNRSMLLNNLAQRKVHQARPGQNKPNPAQQQGPAPIQQAYFGESAELESELADDRGNLNLKLKTHPTYLAVVGSDFQFAKQMLAVVQKYNENIDIGIIRGVLSDLAKMQIMVPVYKGTDSPKSDALEFEGTTKVDPKDARASAEDRERGWKGEVHWEQVPVMEYRLLDPNNKAKGGVVRFATHFFMMPPQYLLYMFLSAHENMHTRRTSFPLLISMRGYPSLLHRWDVLPRKGRILRFENPRVVTEDARMFSGVRSEPAQFAHAISSTNYMNPDKMAQRDTPHYVYNDDDPEFKLYSDWLASSCYSVPVMDENAAWRKETERPKLRWQLFVNQHYDRPGMTEAIIEYMRETMPFFKSSKGFEKVRYPDDLLKSLKRVSRAKRAQRLREQRPNQEILLPEEIEKLKETIEAAYPELKVPIGDDGSAIPESAEDREKREEANAENAKILKDMLAYLDLSMEPERSLDDTQRYDLQTYQKAYGRTDWVLEYLMLEVLELEAKEREKKVLQVRSYQLRTRSDYQAIYDPLSADNIEKRASNNNEDGKKRDQEEARKKAKEAAAAMITVWPNVVGNKKRPTDARAAENDILGIAPQQRPDEPPGPAKRKLRFKRDPPEGCWPAQTLQ